MRIRGQIDTEPVVNYYGQLSLALKQSLPRTIRMEAAATVRKASQLSPVKPVSTGELRQRARQSVIKRFQDGRVAGSVNRYVGKTRIKTPGLGWSVNLITARARPVGPAWDGGKIATPQDHSGHRFALPDGEWIAWKTAFMRAAARAGAAEKARLGARGLTQKSWFDLMVKIAKGEAVAGFSETVRRARPVRGGSRDIAAAIGRDYPGGFELTVVNASGLAAKTGGQRKLNSAVAFRRAFFARNLRQGFFADAKFVARNHKWAVVG